MSSFFYQVFQTLLGSQKWLAANYWVKVLLVTLVHCTFIYIYIFMYMLVYKASITFSDSKAMSEGTDAASF